MSRNIEIKGIRFYQASQEDGICRNPGLKLGRKKEHTLGYESGGQTSSGDLIHLRNQSMDHEIRFLRFVISPGYAFHLVYFL